MPDVILSLTETRGISSAVLKALCSSEGDFQGSIKCDVRLSRKTSSAIWEFTCYMFCGLFNIIGLPAGVYKNQADVAIHIYVYQVIILAPTKGLDSIKELLPAIMAIV